MKKALAALGIAFLLLAPRPAAAQFVTTGDLERSCLSKKREDIAACLNYIAGVIDYHTLTQSFGTAPTIDFCLPPELSIQDASLVVMVYLRSHPQHEAFIASAAVPLALNEAFPCAPKPVKKTKKRKR
jgi:hypothetical protein